MRSAILGLALVAACDNAPSLSTPPVAELPAGSFAELQTKVLAKSCAVGGCHVGASAASAGNLSLEGDAWAALVDVAPASLAAKQDGFRRVRPFRPDSS